MSLDSALLAATSGLRHSARQLSLASQNIANASTEGYTRKTAPGEALGTAGVRTLEAQRSVDYALRAEARTARGHAAAAQLRSDALAPLSQLLGDPADGNSIAGLLGTFRDSLTALRASPGESGAQTQALRTAEDFAISMNEMGTAISRARQAAQDGLRQDVDQANALVREIARLDAQVKADMAAGRNGADALDRRDAAVGRLSELIDIKPVNNSDGSVTLIMNGGSVLPLDPHGSPLGIADAVVGPDSYYGAPAGNLPGLTLGGVPIASKGLGGRIGERFTLRDETLPRMQAELDQLGAVLAQRLEEQGLRLFTTADGGPPPDPTTGAVHGFAQQMRVNPAVAADPRLLRDGTHGVGGFTPNPPGGPTGFTTLLDRVLTYSFGDERAPGVPHTPISGQDLGPGGNLDSTFSPPRRILDYATSVTGALSSEASAAEARASETRGLRIHLDTLVQSREGVDVDAEMAAMVQLQNAYAANARVMAAVQSMWDALLAAVR